MHTAGTRLFLLPGSLTLQDTARADLLEPSMGWTSMGYFGPRRDKTGQHRETRNFAHGGVMGACVVAFVAECLPPSRFGAAVATCKEPGAGKPWKGRLHARCGVVSCPICRIEPDALIVLLTHQGGCQLTRGVDEEKRRKKC